MGTFLVHRLINEQNKKAVESAASAAAEWNILFFLPIYAEGDALIVGALIFTMRGIGKSTPTIKLDSSLLRSQNDKIKILILAKCLRYLLFGKIA